LHGPKCGNWNSSIDLLIAAQRVNHYQEVLLPLREQIIEQTQRQYNAMELGVFQLIVARRDQVRTAQEYVIALRDYSHARATLDLILAGRLVSERGDLGASPGGLEMP
jgi:cobalt-zinc-cadmium efflux system outer membrane protein